MSLPSPRRTRSAADVTRRLSRLRTATVVAGVLTAIGPCARAGDAPTPAAVSVFVNPLGTYDQSHRNVTITGMVRESADESPVTAPSAVQIHVAGPHRVSSSPWLPVTDGAFRWVYDLPLPKSPRDYGTYTVTAVFNGDEGAEHPREDGSDIVSFQLDFHIAVPPGCAAADLCASRLPFAGAPQFVVTHPAANALRFWDCEGTVPSGEITIRWPTMREERPTGPMISRPLLHRPQADGPMRGLAFVPDVRHGGSGPLLALTFEGSTMVRFFNASGQYVSGFPAAVAEPWGLAYDGDGGLWAVDAASGELRKHDLATGTPLEAITPGVAGATDLDWDAATGTLLVLSRGERIVRLDASSGAVLEEIPLRSSSHRALCSFQGGIWVVDGERNELYLSRAEAGSTPGPFEGSTIEPGSGSDAEVARAR